ncbi:MAG: type II toxin-antitoxin system Phd/YefM family antitoxin [Sulfurimicrobium sp.]|nr:type II toxin-antitoxin system Phd/YefM family antitoxin [Sulfurimicrobium sp.]
MKTASVAEAKAHLSALLGNVESGEDVLITRRGKPVGRLIAVRDESLSRFDMTALRDFVAAQPLAPMNKGLTVAEMREQDIL